MAGISSMVEEDWIGISSKNNLHEDPFSSKSDNRMPVLYYRIIRIS